QTVVANEYVTDGHCDRCGALVEARNLEQWFFKITAYADELLRYDLPPGGHWPERTKTIQRNWIGRSEGAEILFRIEELDLDVPVFTTRPDTLFGATFFMLAPEHPLVEPLAERSPNGDELRDYARKTGAKRGEERVNSAQFSGMSAPEGKRAIVEWLGGRGRGRPAISFRLRDWSFSRQRYWGAPIPVVYCDDCGIVPLPYEDLPLLLPDVEDYRPKGVPPLASNEEWLHIPCPRCGGDARREVETMDTFVDSAWYFLRYVDPKN